MGNLSVLVNGKGQEDCPPHVPGLPLSVAAVLPVSFIGQKRRRYRK